MEDSLRFDDPALALLHNQAATCEARLTSIADATPRLDDEAWHGTEKHAWDEERTRFVLWRRDLSSVITEVSERDSAQALNIARSNILANLKDLASDLNEVLAVINGSRLPLEYQARGHKPKAADEEEDGTDSRELVERLDAVNSTISGLSRMLKLQYSYALRTVETRKKGRIGRTRDSAKLSLDSRDEPTTGARPSLSTFQQESISHSPRNSLITTGRYSSKILYPPGDTSSARNATGRQSATSYTLDTHNRLPKQDTAPTKVELPGSDAQDRLDGHALLSPGAKSYNQVMSKPVEFFCRGLIFRVPPSQGSGATTKFSSASSSSSQSDDQGVERPKIYTRPEMLVVVAQFWKHALAVPMCAGDVIDRSKTAIVYAGPTPPPALITDTTTLSPAIRIIPEHSTFVTLGGFPRIDFSKVYTIENRVKCIQMGMVHGESIRPLLEHWYRTVEGLGSTARFTITFADATQMTTDPHQDNGPQLASNPSRLYRAMADPSVGLGMRAPESRHAASKMPKDKVSEPRHEFSKEASESRSVTPSMGDEKHKERVEQSDSQVLGHRFTPVDKEKFGAPIFDPHNPSAEQLQALPDSSIEILLDKLLDEQHRRSRLGAA